MSSLCSGAGFADDFVEVLVSEISSLPGSPKLHATNKFACEIDGAVWTLRRHGQSNPKIFYPDVHRLPVDDMSSVDICMISAMCTSLSLCNRDRRSLRCCDPGDAKQASGATTASALRYVTIKKPNVVIMENVACVSQYRRAPGTVDERPTKDVEFILSQLRAVGYVCGYDVQDTAN